MRTLIVFGLVFSASFGLDLDLSKLEALIGPIQSPNLCIANDSGPQEQGDLSNVTDLINFWGYDVEEHHVKTEDGYILTMHRIPRGRNEAESSKTKYPVFLGHCLLCSSAIYSFGPPDNSLAYRLADAGFDVWMGNTRGNTWSKAHESLDSCHNCTRFWEFSWGITGERDYSAEIDYVLEQTGFDDVFFGGYSMGTTQYLVLLAERPEYNAKIRAGFLMAPAAYMINAESPIFEAADQAWNLSLIAHQAGKDEFLPHRPIFTKLAHNFCDTEHPDCLEICANVFTEALDVTAETLNASMISFYLDHLPAGTSLPTLVHYAANWLNGDTFNKYEFATDTLNELHYGQETPPEYDLSKVIAATFLYVGQRDRLGSPEDGVKINATIGNPSGFKWLNYTHTDFFAADNVGRLVYDDVLAKMEEIGYPTSPRTEKPPSQSSTDSSSADVFNAVFTFTFAMSTLLRLL